MTVRRSCTEGAVHRLTGEVAEWFGIDAGTLREGDRADFVVVDPARLDDSVDGTTRKGPLLRRPFANGQPQ